MSDPPEWLRVNEPLPGSSGGPVEAVKRAVVRALKEGLLGTTITDGSEGIHIDFEYPLEEEQYPGIWVQFTFNKRQRVGIAHEVIGDPVIENEGQPNEWKNWEPIQEWMFEGRVTMTIIALSSLHRDRLSDRIGVLYSFARLPDNIITDPTRDIQQNRAFLRAIAENPYVSMTLNSDELIDGGQSINVGVPWQEDALVYEDSLAFNILGQYNTIFKNDGTYTLRRIDAIPNRVDPDGWI